MSAAGDASGTYVDDKRYCRPDNDIRAKMRVRAARFETAWWVVPYRSKIEALTHVLGKPWTVTALPIPVAEASLPGYIATYASGPATILFVFPDDGRWYSDAYAPDPDPAAPVVAHQRSDRSHTGRFLRMRKGALNAAIDTARARPHLADLIDWYAGDNYLRNPQLQSYIEPLFEFWLTQQGFTEAEADSLRMLVAFGGPDTMASLVRDNTRIVHPSAQ